MYNFFVNKDLIRFRNARYSGILSLSQYIVSKTITIIEKISWNTFFTIRYHNPRYIGNTGRINKIFNIKILTFLIFARGAITRSHHAPSDMLHNMSAIKMYGANSSFRKFKKITNILKHFLDVSTLISSEKSDNSRSHRCF